MKTTAQIGLASSQTINDPGGISIEASSTYGERFVYKEEGFCNGWRDRGWAIFYYVHAFVMLIFAIVVPVKLSKGFTIPTYTPSPFISGFNTLSPQTWYSTTQDSTDFALGYSLKQVIVILFIQGLCGVILGLVWLKLIQNFANFIIKLILFLNLGCFVFIAIIGVINSSVFLIIFGIGGFAVYGLYTYCVWGRIPFSSALLKISSSITQQFDGSICLSLCMIPLSLIWITICITVAVGFVCYVVLQGNGFGITFVVGLLLLISFHWGLQVNKNILHTTICGVTGSWYFNAELNKPTFPALKRTVTTSFGSVCFGSLVVALLQAFRAIVRSQKRNPCCCCMIWCLLKCIEKLISYFNKYAFAQVAIYGCDFIEASKNTWSLFVSRGLVAIINDNLTGNVLTFGTLINGIICFFIGYLLTPLMYNDLDADTISTLTFYTSILGSLIGILFSAAILKVVQSAIISLFVCFAEDPSILKQNRRLQFDMLVSSKIELKTFAETGHTGITGEKDIGNNIKQELVFTQKQQTKAYENMDLIHMDNVTEN